MGSKKSVVILFICLLALIAAILYALQFISGQEQLPAHIINTEQPFDGKIPK